MSTEPIRNILSILFGEITGQIFFIFNTNKNKKMKREEIKERLEKSKYDCTKLNDILVSLTGRNILIKTDVVEKIEDKKNNDQKNPNINYKKHYKNVKYHYYQLNYTELKKLKEIYKNTKDSIIKNLEYKSKRKWICINCGESYDANCAFRDTKCKNKNYKKCNLIVENGEDVTDILKKCNDIFKILDIFFAELENQMVVTTKVKEYLKSKYGKDYSNEKIDNVNIVEENDPYVQYTIDKIQSQRTQINKKEDYCLNFCKLVECFSSNNQKIENFEDFSNDSFINNDNSV